MKPVSVPRAQEILTSAAGAAIAVLGDVMLDRYFWGTVNRISPEAPVPVVDVDDESYHLGGAANVAANIGALGATPMLFGVVGDDASGRMLRQIAESEGMDVTGLIASNGRPTTVKTRVIGNNQQLIRLDRETRSDVDAHVVQSVVDVLRSRPDLRGIIFEDYDKGFLTPTMITSVIAVARERGIPVFVDPKRNGFNAYRSCFLFKPNRKEASDALGYSIKSDDDVRKAGAELLSRLDCDNVLITLGSAGMMLFERGGKVSSVPTVAKKVADVSGAGDTAIATLATMVAGGASVSEAAMLSNIAAGVVVGEPGIVAITTKALIDAVHDDALLHAGTE